MKTLILTLTVNLVALSCVGVAGYLAVHQLSGWGWFLFIALLTTVSKVERSKD